MSLENKSRLGKGLRSMIRPAPPVNASELATPSPSPVATERTPRAGQMIQVSVSDVIPNTFQPRKSIDPVILQGLADSIRTTGVMQPVSVRRSSQAGAKWELVAGERRWRAAQLAGLSEIPAIINELDDRGAAEWAIIENVQREDLNAIERGLAFRNLAEHFGLSQTEIAGRVGIDRSSVANLMRLCDLEAEIQQQIASGALSGGHGKALLMMSPGAQRIEVAERARREGWSVRRLERWVSLLAQGIEGSLTSSGGAGATVSASLTNLERQLADHLGTRVRIQTDSSRTKGRITIEFFSLEQFDGLMERFGFQPQS